MSLLEAYDHYWNELGDPRTNDWLFISSIYTIPFILIAYLYLVLYAVPRYMKDRQPYSLKTFIKFYNIVQVVGNFLIVKSFFDAGWFTDIMPTWHCEQIDYSFEFRPYKLAVTMWWVLIMKLLDLVETLVFVLRKKDRQVSFLHVYHHVTTLIIQWILTKYYAGGMITFGLLLNCSVHVAMYSYYFLSTFGPITQKMIAPFKPMITIIQMVQFVIMLGYALQAFVPGCAASNPFTWIVFADIIYNFYLFYQFYRETYITVEEAKKCKSN